VSVRDRLAGPEEDFDEEELFGQIVEWPAEAPIEPLSGMIRRSGHRLGD
jgi:hypothetical protein